MQIDYFGLKGLQWKYSTLGGTLLESLSLGGTDDARLFENNRDHHLVPLIPIVLKKWCFFHKADSIAAVGIHGLRQLLIIP